MRKAYYIRYAEVTLDEIAKTDSLNEEMENTSLKREQDLTALMSQAAWHLPAGGPVSTDSQADRSRAPAMGVLTGDKTEVIVHSTIDTGVFQCFVVGNGPEVRLHVPGELHEFVSKASTATVLEFEVHLQGSLVIVTCDPARGARILLHPATQRGPYAVAELFGGISGWSYAARACGGKTAIIVEHDPMTAQACARAHQCPLMDSQLFLAKILDGTFTGTCVLLCDVRDTKMWMGLSLLNVNTLLISPPCQPWSSAGRERGMQCDDGRVFSDVLQKAGWSRIHSVLAENVPGITKHPDFQTLIAGAALDGMKMVLSGVFACHRVLPLYRDRWLATFVHSSISFTSSRVVSIQALSFASEAFQCPMPGPTLRSADAVMDAMDDPDRTEVMIDDDAMKMLCRSDLVPTWVVEKIDWSLNQPVFASRCIDGDAKLSGVMARYGSQHKLPITLLMEKGLQTMIYNDRCNPRYFAPFEILAALGFPKCTVLSGEVGMAYQQAGNAISLAHAILQIVKSHMLLEDKSPFAVTDAAAVLSDMFKAAIHLSEVVPTRVDDFRCLKERVKKDPERPAAKKQKTDVVVSPTVPFTIQSTQVPLVTKDLDFEPAFTVKHQGTEVSRQPFCNGGLVQVRHVQKHWLTVVHGSHNESVGSLIHRALPHAKESHFCCFSMNNAQVGWQDTVQCHPMSDLIFTPNPVPFEFKWEHGPATCLIGDVTWTIDTARAFLATDKHCNVDSIRLMHESLPTTPGDFVTDFKKPEFQVSFQAMKPPYANPSDACQVAKDTGLVPKMHGHLRFLAKHPLMKITKTACAAQTMTFAELVRLLFPDLATGVSWTVHVDATEVDTTAVIRDCQAFVVEWKGYRPIAPTEVCLCEFAWPIGTSDQQVEHAVYPARWIKSPFTTKAAVLHLRESSAIAQVAASFVSHSMLNTQITCQIGGMLLDPLLTLSDVPTTEVLSFKIAPLIGGAKPGQFDQIKGRIKSCMEAHGVSKDTSADRLAAFAAKADMETLAKSMSDDDLSFWKAIKDEANRLHFRLVYRNEQQIAKKEGRAKPPNKQQKGPSKPFGKHNNKEFVASASNIKIDPAYFTCEGDPIELIDSSRFGPDQRGLAIMNFNDAEKHTQGIVSSMDPLAILLVGQKFGANDEVFSMPAFTSSGAPIVIKAALRQFGDTEVRFKAIVPTVKVAETATTVLEIHIYRCEVTQWKECAVPLHYLGVHCSAVRGNNLMATWAMKTFNNERKPTPFQSADYWHGFIRVQDSLLDLILVRSGFAGIYISPKSAEKRHDDRFTAITLPNCNLADIQKKAAACDKALGIVKIRDQLAIRCKRDQAPVLRSTLVPEAAFVATDTVQQDEELWVLKQVPSEIGKEGLEQALTLAAWNAHPVRAQGLNRWIVASSDPPPSHHLIINGSFVLVEPLKRGPEPAVTIVAKQVKVDTVTSDGSMQVATSSRFQEVKAEMSDHFESKLALANNRIEQLAAQLQEVQSAQAQTADKTQHELTHLREEQAFARQKIGEVESSVIASGQAVVNQMQQMMNQMQSGLQLSLERSLKQMIPGNVEEKRPRTEETPKNDQFSTHWRSRQGRRAWGLSNACHNIFLCILAVFLCNVGCANAYFVEDNYPLGLQSHLSHGYPSLHHAETRVMGCTSHRHFHVLNDQLISLFQSVPTRFGEAENPGPLKVGTFNPAQLKGNEGTVADWGSGIWGASETSHTPAALSLSATAFRKLGFNSVWPKPVTSLNNTIGSLRGKASGTAVVSDLPMARFPINVPDDVDATSRLVESIVHLGNGVNMFVASVYGPAYGRTHIDPWTMLSRVCEVAFEHARAFKGPAVVLGDFNVESDDVPHWQAMNAQGWADAALLDAMRRGTQPSFTSKSAARKSFIFICPQLVSALLHCDICEEYTFDAHPLLCAHFDIDVVKSPRTVWNLPRSTDDLYFDRDVMTHAVQDDIGARRYKFDRAIQSDDPEEALRQVNVCFENACAKACTDENGLKTRFPKACYGRGRRPIVKTIHASAPVVKNGRHDHFTPDICQPPLHIRRITKQMRRIQSLRSQLAARVRSELDGVGPQCEQLWHSILHAEGFTGGFQQFALQHLQCFVPLACPTLEYVRFLAQTFLTHVYHEVAEVKKVDAEKRKNNTLQDFAKGGKLTFAAVRDNQVQPFQTIANQIVVDLPRQRWTKEGKSRLLTTTKCTQLDQSLPAVFQGQTVSITEVCDRYVVLDRPVKLKQAQPLQLTQIQMHCDVPTVQKITCDAWGQMWNRDEPDDHMGNWTHIADRLTCLGDCPSLDFQPLQVDEWKHHARAVKKGSARGSCGYTPKELTLMPDSLTELLLQLLTNIEQAVINWPPSLMFARVVMLAKTDLPPTNPLHTRPITIISRLYRTWSRYRSFQIIAHIQSQLPPAIAGTAKGVSSEMLAAHVLCEVEQAHQDNDPRLGITVDLVKCYNRIPRRPVLAALATMGVPREYLTALDSVFQSLARYLEIGGQIGAPQRSTTGVPEGCCFSIVCMLALTAWTSAVIHSASPQTTCVAYADNWELIAETYHALLASLDALIALVDDLHMEIAVDKSWLWATHAAERKLLRNVTVRGRQFPLKHVATDLGCDVSYGRRITKTTTKKRIAKAKRVLARVGKNNGRRRSNVLSQNSLPQPSSAMAPNSPFTHELTWRGFEQPAAAPFVVHAGGPIHIWHCLRLVMQMIHSWLWPFANAFSGEDTSKGSQLTGSLSLIG